MRTKHWQQYNKTEQLQLLDITSGKTGLPRLAIEKDWWVTMVLKALSMTQYAHLMSFKGGTSLSKGWQLINRFSEDIDIALNRKERFAICGTSNTQLAKARRVARHYIVRELPDELHNALLSLGITGFKVEPEIFRTKDGAIIEMRADTKLYSDIITHRSIYNKLPHVDYNTHQQHQINFLPPKSVMEDWKEDYTNMKKNFIYTPAILSFENLIERISELQERIRNMQK